MNFSNGAWACLDAFFYNLVSSVCTITSSSPALTTANYYIVAVVIFAVSQFIFAVLCVLLPPRLVLLLAYAGSITFSALIMGLDLHSVNGTVSMVLVLTIFEAPMFPLIFAIGLRGLGRWTIWCLPNHLRFRPWRLHLPLCYVGRACRPAMSNTSLCCCRSLRCCTSTCSAPRDTRSTQWY